MTKKTKTETTTKNEPTEVKPTVKTTKSNSVSTVVTLWRKSGKSSNTAKTNNLLELLIEKTGMK